MIPQPPGRMPADPGATRRRRHIGPGRRAAVAAVLRAVLTAAALVTAHHLLDGSAPGSFSESPTTSNDSGTSDQEAVP